MLLGSTDNAVNMKHVFELMLSNNDVVESVDSEDDDEPIVLWDS